MDQPPASPGAVEQHYGGSDLETRVRSALAALGDAPVSWADLAPLDQFHVRGLAASREMAAALRLSPGTTVLDVGCGLGGPARFLAANHGCVVTGIDLNRPFIDVARLLTATVSLHATFDVMDALDLRFPDDSFDCAWTQHVAMNIRDRARFYANIHRVLKPGGRLAIYDVAAGDRGPLHFPVPWASTPEISFLLTPQEMQNALRDAGFAEISSAERTAEGIAWLGQQQASLATGQPPPALGLHVILGPEFAAMAANLGRNLQEGRAVLVQTIAAKPAFVATPGQQR